MPHGDHHTHGHHPPAPSNKFDRRFAVGTALNLGFVVVQTGFGFAAHSSALLADALHNLGDALGLLLAWGAAALSRRAPSRTHTYGYGRSSILASLINAVVLLIGIGAVAAEAVRRLIQPEAVAASAVMAVSACGIVVNGITAFMFMRGNHDDLNIRGTFLHMAMDAAISAGVVAAGAIILLTGWHWVDPIASLAIAAFLIGSSWNLLRSSLRMAMDGVPDRIDRTDVENHLLGQPGVTDIHDLHIWALSTTNMALTVHLVGPTLAGDDAFLARLRHDLLHEFGIGHATFQIESGDAAHPCSLAPADTV